MQHVNHTLPPVGVNIMIKLNDGTFKKAIRDSWITSADTAFAVKVLESGESQNIKRGKVAWTYY